MGRVHGDGRKEIRCAVISALPYVNSNDQAERMIGSAASWSLTSQASNHSRVLSIVKSESKIQTEEIASILGEIISEARRA